MAVVSVSLPDALVEQVDAFIADRGYAGRSEMVRSALRDFLAHETTAPVSGTRSATLTLLYPEGQERKIGEIRHGFTDIVRSMMHAHAHTHCVEVFVLEGAALRIQQFADALRAAKDTRLVETVYTDASAGDAGDHHGHAH